MLEVENAVRDRVFQGANPVVSRQKTGLKHLTHQGFRLDLSQFVAEQQPTKTAVPLYCAPVTLWVAGAFLFSGCVGGYKEQMMTDWMIWFGLAGSLVILEMFTGTFYMLMIAIGFVAGGGAALLGAAASMQLVAAALVGVIATYGLRRSNWGKTARRDTQRNPDVNLDIGQSLVIEEWSGSEGGIRTSRAMYRGAMWDVELEAGTRAKPGRHVIREVRGNRLVVAEAGTDNQ
jgi:membrane protein implicated in regulation of membrane protease activity